MRCHLTFQKRKASYFETKCHRPVWCVGSENESDWLFICFACLDTTHLTEQNKLQVQERDVIWSEILDFWVCVCNIKHVFLMNLGNKLKCLWLIWIIFSFHSMWINCESSYHSQVHNWSNMMFTCSVCYFCHVWIKFNRTEHDLQLTSDLCPSSPSAQPIRIILPSISVAQHSFKTSQKLPHYALLHMLSRISLSSDLLTGKRPCFYLTLLTYLLLTFELNHRPATYTNRVSLHFEWTYIFIDMYTIKIWLVDPMLTLSLV